jgi:hypothetical protein
LDFEETMDIVFIGASALMFVLIAGMVVGCDKLGARP